MGHTRVDEYYWLREKDNPAVIANLDAENAYTKAVMAHTAALQESLYEEIKSRVKERDSSAPSKLGDYQYYTRYEEGREYPIYCRRHVPVSEEEILLSVNERAEGHEFFNVFGDKVGPSQTAGLEDPAVQFWEPAKWVVKQRQLRTDSNRLLLKTEMSGGHGGPSGRYRKNRESALMYAFMLDLLPESAPY